MSTMTVKQTVHIEAPVEKVFDYLKDPTNWNDLSGGAVDFKDVRLTKEGLGTSYSWVAKVAGLRLEGFDVFTDFVPNKRITDKSSRAFEGTWTYSFEPVSSGTKVTLESRARSVWGLPPLSMLVDRFAAKGHERTMSAFKARMEA